LSVDPVVTDTQTGKSFNRYVYANNSPYRFKDPDGRWAEDLVLGIPSLAIGSASLVNNWRQGNLGAAAVDAIGMVADTAAIALPGVPGGAGLAIAGVRAAEAGVAKATGEIAKAGQNASKAFSKEKQALVEMAKGDKKTGMTSGDMQAYKDLNKGLPDSFPTNKVRGPEAHSSGAPSSQSPHGHVGPVDHIPIKDPK